MSEHRSRFRPSDSGYTEAFRTNNESLTHRPSLVVTARDVDDVVAAVASARTSGQSVGVQATGHGMSVPSDGVLIASAQMSNIAVDASARRLRVGAGARFGDVLATTVPHGLAPLHGSSPAVGVAGFTLGGGVGPLGRMHGYGVDHVRSLTLVAADASVLTVSADENPELFWAVRGGKGNFGVVTELELDLFPVGEFLGGGLYFDGSSGSEIVAAYSDWARQNGRETATSLLLATFPDADGVPGPLRGRAVAHLRFAHFGDFDAGVQRLDLMRGVAPILLDTVKPMPYSDIALVHHDPDGPYEVVESGFFVGPIVDAQADALAEAATRPMVVELRHHGGAYAGAPADQHPVAGRDAEFTVYLGSAPQPDARAVHSRVRAAFQGNDHGTVLNFLGVDTEPEWIRHAFSPDDLERLVRLKRDVDPDNLFRVNHNLPKVGS